MPTKFIQYGNEIQFITWEKDRKGERKKASSRVPPSLFGLPVYGLRRPDSLRRSKTILVRRVLCAIEEFGSPILLTLTYNDTKSEGAHNSRVSSEALRAFSSSLRGLYPGCCAVFVPEVSPNNRIHYHGLLFGVPETIGDKVVGRNVISLGTERASRGLAKAWGIGFVDAKRTDGNPRLAYYLGKYLTKCGSDPLLGRSRLVRYIGSFPKPYTSTGAFAEELRRRYIGETTIYKVKSNTPFMGHLEIIKYSIT